MIINILDIKRKYEVSARKKVILCQQKCIGKRIVKITIVEFLTRILKQTE